MFSIESEEELLRQLFASKLRIARRRGEKPELAELEAMVRQSRAIMLQTRLETWEPRFGNPRASQEALAYYTEGDGLTVKGFGETV